MTDPIQVLVCSEGHLSQDVTDTFLKQADDKWFQWKRCWTAHGRATPPWRVLSSGAFVDVTDWLRPRGTHYVSGRTSVDIGFADDVFLLEYLHSCSDKKVIHDCSTKKVRETCVQCWDWCVGDSAANVGNQLGETNFCGQNCDVLCSVREHRRQ